MHLYDRSQIDRNRLLYTDKAIWKLMLPIICEQFLNSFMGTADTVMVSKLGDIAVSSVSLVDSLNNMIVQVFSALAAGATIAVAQYIGKRDREGANSVAQQVFIAILAISLALGALCIAIKEPLLRLIFGSIEPEVMEGALTYFTITAASYPFLALSNAGSSFFRASGNSRFPMLVSTLANVVNLAGNAIAIFVLKWGVAGAALATLLSRVANTAVLYIALRNKEHPVHLRNYFSIRPNFKIIALVLSIGIPAGIESGMFQFGKLAVQSTVSTLGTEAISAQAIAIVLELFSAYGGCGIGIGMMTVVGQAIGAHRIEEAKYYTIRCFWFGELATVVSCLLVFAFAKPLIAFSGLSEESAAICWQVFLFIHACKLFLWAPSFLFGYGMRAAGDVRFSMILSTLSMWLLRVVLSVLLVRVFHVGLIAVWIGMASDWLMRSICFFARFRSGKWLKKALV